MSVFAIVLSKLVRRLFLQCPEGVVGKPFFELLLGSTSAMEKKLK